MGVCDGKSSIIMYMVILFIYLFFFLIWMDSQICMFQLLLCYLFLRFGYQLSSTKQLKFNNKNHRYCDSYSRKYASVNRFFQKSKSKKALDLVVRIMIMTMLVINNQELVAMSTMSCVIRTSIIIYILNSRF